MNCKACNHKFKLETENIYSICSECGTYSYISTNNASEDNNEYFNTAYTKLDSYNKSKSKKLLYRFLNKIDRVLNRQNKNTIDVKKELSNIDTTSIPALEVGFGRGAFLLDCLNSDINIFGVDISSTAVTNFKEKHTLYSNRVSNSLSITNKVSAVYVNALFEHLDDHSEFLKTISDKLNDGGKLIINGLPLVVNAESQKTFSIDEDINFWKPCHRVIFSEEGLNELLKRNNFIIEHISNEDRYLYRVMSAIIAKGYSQIDTIRNPFVKTNVLPRGLSFLATCLIALKRKSIAGYSCVIAKKINNIGELK